MSPAPNIFGLRSYAGDAAIAQLSQEIGSGDTTFTISPTTGWVESYGANAGQPLGTSGPFTVAIDLYTPSLEKIDCSSINLNTGVVTVNTSTGYSGRGFDGTTPQAHVPGASSTGVQPCWSSEEAYAANQAVAYALGGGIALSTLANNPAGRVHAVTGSVTAGLDNPVFTTVVSDFLKGSMTTSTHGLTVPVTGWYQINAEAIFTNGASAAQPSCFLYKNSAAPALSAGDQNRVAIGDIYTLAINDIVPLTAADTIALYSTIDVGTATLGNVNHTQWNYLSASLVCV